MRTLSKSMERVKYFKKDNGFEGKIVNLRGVII